MTELETRALPGPEERQDETVDPAAKKESKPRGRAAVKIRLETLETELQDRIREYVAVPIGFVSPLACAVLDERAERTSKAMCRIAATSPKFRKALERFVSGSAAVDLIGTGIAVVIAIGVDAHRVPPTSMPARFANIPELWNTVYDEPIEVWNIYAPNGNGEVSARGGLFEEEPEQN